MNVRTLADLLPVATDRNPDAAAVISGDTELSYLELERRSAALAAALLDAGVERGDRVLTVLPNGLTAAVAAHGVFRSGGALVPLAEATKLERLRYIAEDVRPAAVICDPTSRERVERAVKNGGHPGVIDDVNSLPDPTNPLPAPLGDDLAAVLYTSGSTGKPKGVMLTHHNLSFATDSIVEYLRLSRADRILCVLQLSFGYGLSQLLCCSRAGGGLVLEKGFALPGDAINTLARREVTGLPGVPTIFHVLASLSGLADRELPHLRFLTNAGAALPAAVVSKLRRIFPGVELFSMYGLTECIRVSYLEPYELDRRPSSCGKPIPGTKAWVERTPGEAAEPGEIGELIVRGPHVMQAYWGDQGATAERLRAGRWPWERELLTGDLVRQDKDGFLFWLGRTDDLIKCRGEKVYPREVEEVLHAIDGVREAAVVGVSDRLLGEQVTAHIVASGARPIDSKLIRRSCAEMLEPHMIPGQVHFYEALPRTPRGKLDKAALIETATRAA